MRLLAEYAEISFRLSVLPCLSLPEADSKTSLIKGRCGFDWFGTSAVSSPGSQG